MEMVYLYACKLNYNNSHQIQFTLNLCINYKLKISVVNVIKKPENKSVNKLKISKDGEVFQAFNFETLGTSKEFQVIATNEMQAEYSVYTNLQTTSYGTISEYERSNSASFILPPAKEDILVIHSQDSKLHDMR